MKQIIYILLKRIANLRRATLFHGASKRIWINLNPGVGDFILVIPVIKNIRLCSKNVRIDALIPLSLYKTIRAEDYFDDVIIERVTSIPCRRFVVKFAELIKLLRIASSENVDVVINPISVFNITTCLVTSLSCAKEKIGFNWKNSSGIYTHSVEVKKNEHDINQNLKLLNSLGIEHCTKKTEFIVSERDIKDADAFLASCSVNEKDILVALHPVTEGMKGFNPRIWDKDKFVKVGQLIIKKCNAKLIIVGNKKERNIAEEIKENIGKNSIVQAGKTSLQTVAAIIKKCDLLITNDSGIMHLGYAADVPMVAIWGPTDPRRRGYIDEKRIVIKKNLPCQPCGEKPEMQNCKTLECLKQITVKEVFDASCKLLDKWCSKRKIKKIKI